MSEAIEAIAERLLADDPDDARFERALASLHAALRAEWRRDGRAPFIAECAARLGATPPPGALDVAACEVAGVSIEVAARRLASALGVDGPAIRRLGARLELARLRLRLVHHQVSAADDRVIACIVAGDVAGLLVDAAALATDDAARRVLAGVLEDRAVPDAVIARFVDRAIARNGSPAQIDELRRVRGVGADLDSWDGDDPSTLESVAYYDTREPPRLELRVWDDLRDKAVQVAEAAVGPASVSYARDREIASLLARLEHLRLCVDLLLS